MTALMHGARLVDAHGERDGGWLLFDGDTIAAAGTGAGPDAEERVDVGGAIVVPGFVELHSHGGGGHGHDDGPEAMRAGLAAHREHGTTRSLVSLVSNPVDRLARSLAEVADLADSDPLVLGSHLEGPFLAAPRRGAHAPEFLRAPAPADVEILLRAARGTLRQITIAPELPGALDAIDRLVAAGVVVAIGHTEADYASTRAAIDRGARLLTHAFNAMRGIHHREPGPVVAAFDDERVVLELVLDGVHVHPSVVGMAFRAAPRRVALVTDAMSAAAGCDGHYRLGSLEVAVRDGVATIDGTSTIAGSTLTQDAALRIAVTRAGVPLVDAVAALTLTPARVLGLDDRLGLLAPGFAADAVVLDEQLEVTEVWAAGRRIR